MTLVVGIDEAGFGPLLGPLVVGAVAFEVPDELTSISLWRLLSPAVARNAVAAEGRCPPIRVADSKQLYHGLRGSVGLGALERGVLAFLAAAAHTPADLCTLLERLSPGSGAACRRLRWYADLTATLPVACGSDDLAAVTGRLVRRFERSGVRLAAVRAEVVLEDEFNRSVTSTANKAELLFAVSARHLTALRAAFPGARMLVHCDRQGARMRYLPSLGAALPGAFVWVVHEDDATSVYRVEDAGREIEVDFTVGGEQRHLPVALASMVAKYVREQLMARLNAFFAARVAALEPTAGYRPDGWRFLRDVAPALAELALTEAALRRTR